MSELRFPLLINGDEHQAPRSLKHLFERVDDGNTPDAEDPAHTLLRDEDVTSSIAGMIWYGFWALLFALSALTILATVFVSAPKTGTDVAVIILVPLVLGYVAFRFGRQVRRAMRDRRRLAEGRFGYGMFVFDDALVLRGRQVLTILPRKDIEDIRVKEEYDNDVHRMTYRTLVSLLDSELSDIELPSLAITNKSLSKKMKHWWLSPPSDESPPADAA